MKESTKDKVSGTVKTIKGTIKEAAGKAVGNPNLRDKRRAEQIEGKVQKKVGDVKKAFNRQRGLAPPLSGSSGRAVPV